LADRFRDDHEPVAGRRPPPRSRAQREDPLWRATAVRRQRAQLKRDLKAGHGAITEVLIDDQADRRPSHSQRNELAALLAD
jgi:hypothetical protein